MGHGRRRYERMSELFADALEVAPAERAAWLVEQCPGDDDLQQDVMRLLESHGEGSDAALPLAPPVDWIPERVGTYLIRGCIGQGGMGVVYEALQESPRRKVAVKLMHPVGATVERAQRFRREAELLGRLVHPGIARILESGTYDAGFGVQPYFAMEYIDGLSLDEFVRRRKLSKDEKLIMMARVCDAVEYAHEAGVIHRDLKPENILVDERGDPKVLDFGIARIEAGGSLDSSFATRDGQILGTLAYMAPEQLRPQPGAVTARSDVYALGALAFQVLAGRPPHQLSGLSTAAALAVVSGDEPVRLGVLDPSLRGDVDTAVGKALDADPDRRYGSAAELALDLRAIVANRPIGARPPSRRYLALKFTRRHRGLVGGVAAALLATIAGLIVSVVFGIRAAESARLADQRARAALAHHLQDAVDLLEGGRPFQGAFALREGWASHGDWETELLRTAMPMALPKQDGLFGAAWLDSDHVAVPLAAGGIQVLTVPGGRSVRVFAEDEQWLSSGRHVWIKRDRSAVILADETSGRILQRVDCPPGSPSMPVLHLDDRGRVWSLIPPMDVVDSSGHGWEVWRDGVHMSTIEHRIGSVNGLSFSPDGSCIVYSAPREGEIQLFDSGTGHSRGIVRGLRVSSCARSYFTPDSSELLTFAGDSELVVIDAQSAALKRRTGFYLHDSCAGGVLSPDGRRFFTDGLSGYVEVVDVETGRVELALPLQIVEVVSRVKLSPDGTKLLISPMDAGYLVVEMGMGTESAFDLPRVPSSLTFSGHDAAVQSLILSPDGQMAVSYAPEDAFLRIWDVCTGAPIAALPKPTFPFGVHGTDRGVLMAFSADGTELMATVGGSGDEPPRLLAWDLVTGEFSTETLEAGRPRMSHLVWLDRFLERLGPAPGPAVRFGRKALRAPTGEVYAIQQFAGFQLPDGERWESFVRRNKDEALAISPDGGRMAVAGARELTVFETETRLPVYQEPGGTLSVAWSPDGRLIAAGNTEGHIQLVDGQGLYPLYRFRAHGNPVMCLAWSKDGQRLVSGSTDGTLRVWDPRGQGTPDEGYGTLLEAARGRTQEALRRGAEGAATDEARFVAVRALLERLPKAEVAAASVQPATDDDDRPDPQPSAPQLAQTLVCEGHGSYLYALAVSPDGQLAASTGPDCDRIRLWSLATAAEVASIPKPRTSSGGADNRDQLMAFSVDGRFLYATVRSRNSAPELWRWDLLGGVVSTQAAEGRLAWLSHQIWLDPMVEAFQRDRVSGSGTPSAPPGAAARTRRLGRTASLWLDDVAVASRQWELLRSPLGERWLPAPGIEGGDAVDLAPDGRFVALGGRRRVRLLDRVSGTALSTSKGPTWSVAFSPDGEFLAAGGRDGRIRILNGSDLTTLDTWTGHTGYVFGLAWTPGGERLVSCSGDKTLRVWDTRTSEERAAAKAQSEKLMARVAQGLPPGGAPEANLAAWERCFLGAQSTAEQGAVLRAGLLRRSRAASK